MFLAALEPQRPLLILLKALATLAVALNVNVNVNVERRTAARMTMANASSVPR
jgi:hypothetical protein